MSESRKPRSYQTIKTKITSSLQKFGFRAHADDCTQEYCVYMLEGKSQHQTIDQFVIDYLRRTRGGKRVRSYSQRQNFENADSIGAGAHEPAHHGYMGKHLETRIDCVGSLGRIQNRTDREMSILFFHYGYHEAEIANHYKVTESRVSQRLQRVQKCLSERVARTTRRQSKGAQEMEILGGIETQIIPFPTSERVAFEKPREVAKLDEARFEKWIA